MSVFLLGPEFFFLISCAKKKHYNTVSEVACVSVFYSTHILCYKLQMSVILLGPKFFSLFHVPKKTFFLGGGEGIKCSHSSTSKIFCMVMTGKIATNDE